MNIKRWHLFWFYFDWFLYKIIHRIAFNTLENIKNQEHHVIIKPGFVKIRMQIIHTIYYVNLYF